ncbi:MAG: DUF805 domain-containing protein [Novosphingobium sp.]
MEWMILPYKRYFDFSGRSRRKEYWLYTLFTVLVFVAIVAVGLAGMPWSEMSNHSANPQPGPLLWGAIGTGAVFWLGTLIPSIAVTVRRFHDQNQSGWLYLLGLIPYVGGLVLIVFMCLEGTRGENRFGPDPKDPSSADVFI